MATMDQNCPESLAPDPSMLPENPVVAMAYIPFQQYGSVYSAEKALDNGTLFPDLNKPFTGRGSASK